MITLCRMGRSEAASTVVIPAKAGIQTYAQRLLLYPHFRGDGRILAWRAPVSLSTETALAQVTAQAVNHVDAFPLPNLSAPLPPAHTLRLVPASRGTLGLRPAYPARREAVPEESARAWSTEV